MLEINKKYPWLVLVLCSLLVCVLPSWAIYQSSTCGNRSGIGSGGAPSVPCSECGTCGGCATADLLCEDWDTDNGCTWTDVTTGGTISHTASPSGSWDCTDVGSYVTQITRASDNDNPVYTYSDIGVQTTGYQKFSWKIPNFGDLGSFNDIYIGGFDDNTDLSALPIRWFYYHSTTEGSRQIRLYYRESSAYVLLGSKSSVNNTDMYELSVYWSRGGGAGDDTVTAWVDGVQIGTVTDAELDTTPRYVVFGDPGETANRNVVMQYGPLEIDDDTMPSDCPN